jgi:hypothetical protein
MRRIRFGITGVVALLLWVAGASPSGQEAHPMSGSWVGEWKPTPSQQTRVVVVMEWTGTELAGTINPGPNAIPFRTATVKPGDWSVHIEADTRDAQGRVVTHVIDGTIDNLGSYRRDLSGTWTVGSVKGPFKILRQ